MSINQVGFSVIDKERSRDWYGQVLGCVPSGGMDIPAPPPGERSGMSRVQGVPGADGDVRWALDAQAFFQLEFFQYRSPTPRPLPPDWRLCDIGYGLVGFHVADFDGALARLDAVGSAPLTQPLGDRGARRVCARDPDGALIELMEADLRTPAPADRPRAEIGTVTRSVTASVSDLERSRRFFVDTLGMKAADDAALHGPEHERLWGLDGASREQQLLWAGDFWIELVQYADPVGKPRPADYRISDLGIANFALGFRSIDLFRATVDRVVAHGYVTHEEFEMPGLATRYTMDDQAFSVELFYVDAAADESVGLVLPGG